MKTRLILLLVLILCAVKGESTTTDQLAREIELSLAEEGKGPRSTIDIPAKAFLKTPFVHITFTEDVNNVSISIVNTITNQDVFTQTYSNFGDISINLEGENSGNYKLVMEIDGMVVWGSFNL